MDVYFHSLEQPRQVMVRKAIRPTMYSRLRREEQGRTNGKRRRDRVPRAGQHQMPT